MNPQSLAAFACLVAVLIAGVCGAENVENLKGTLCRRRERP
jgi:hypothetical protein